MASSWLRHHWGWVVTGATCIAFFFSYGFILSFSVLFVTFQREFDSSATATAWVGSLPFGLSAIVAPLVNLLIERIGYRAVVVIGISMLSAGLIVTSFMPSLAPLYFTYSALFGVGTGCILTGSFNLILKYFPGKNSTGGIVLPMASSNLGMLSLGPLTFYLENRFGWRNTVRISAGMTVGIALPAVAWAHREPRGLSTSEAENNNDEESALKHVKGQRENALAFELNVGEDGESPDEVERLKSPSRECDACKDNACNYSSSIRTCSEEFESGGVKVDTDNQEQSDRLLSCSENYQRLTETRPNHVTSIDKEKVSSNSLKANYLDESVIHASPSMARRMLTALTFPDVWCLALAVFGYGLTNSFFIIQLGSYMMSLGFTDENGAHAVVALGVSMMAGKVTLAMVSDYIPFHQLYLSTFVSGLGISVMICLLQAPGLTAVMCMVVVLGATVFSISDALPYFSPNLVFGIAKGRETASVLAFMHGVGIITASVLGESMDQTGSYDIALYTCIGTYALCGLLCLMVPVYQKCMVTDRYIMQSWKGCNRKKHRETAVNHEVMENF